MFVVVLQRPFLRTVIVSVLLLYIYSCFFLLLLLILPSFLVLNVNGYAILLSFLSLRSLSPLIIIFFYFLW